MPVSFLRDSVTVIRPAWREERGTRIPDWTAATEHTLTGCRVQPVSGAVLLRTGTANRDGVDRRWRLFAPPGADLDEHDRVRHAGKVYVIDSAIERWPSPTGALASTQALLQLAEG